MVSRVAILIRSSDGGDWWSADKSNGCQQVAWLSKTNPMVVSDMVEPLVLPYC